MASLRKSWTKGAARLAPAVDEHATLAVVTVQSSHGPHGPILLRRMRQWARAPFTWDYRRLLS
jgi:hypothetical protein